MQKTPDTLVAWEGGREGGRENRKVRRKREQMNVGRR